MVRTSATTFVDLASYGSTEGIAIDAEGNIYVTTLNTGKVLRVTPDREVSVFAAIPGFVGTPQSEADPPQQNGLIGLAIDGAGDLYALVAAWFGGEVNGVVGVYKISRGGSRVELFAGGKPNGMVFPNFPTFDKAGNLFVSDSTIGAIFRITPSGACSAFVPPTPALQAPAGARVPVGANGIAFTPSGDALVVAVTFTYPTTDPDNPDVRGKLVKVAVNWDGSAGAITPFVEVVSPDGIVYDRDGSLYVAQNFDNSIAKVSKAGQVTVIARGEPLAMPASLAIRGRTLFATNLAFAGGGNITAVDLSSK